MTVNTDTSDSPPWKAQILTIFPEMFPGPLALSLAGQGLKNKIWTLETINIRDFAQDKHQTVDDSTFGGGPGMVMRPDVVDAAIKSTSITSSNLPLLYLTPRGKTLTQCKISELSKSPGVRIICGRYEGLDQRVVEANNAEELSVSDFILSGGEPAAISLLDACVRLLPGIVGKKQSLIEESFRDGLLEYAQYTRPKIWNGHEIPEVLLSGNHKQISRWRLENAKITTESRRPDLWELYLQKQNQTKKTGGI